MWWFGIPPLHCHVKSFSKVSHFGSLAEGCSIHSSEWRKMTEAGAWSEYWLCRVGRSLSLPGVSASSCREQGRLPRCAIGGT